MSPARAADSAARGAGIARGTRPAGRGRDANLAGRLGHAAFFVGCAVFVATLTLGEFAMHADTRASLERSGTVREDHRAALDAALAGHDGRTFGTPWTFLAGVGAAIDEANAELGGAIGSYDRGRYRFELARAATDGPIRGGEAWFLAFSVGLASLGALVTFAARARNELPGIKNDGNFHSSTRNRGAVGIAIGTALIAFYVLLYFRPEYIVNWIRLTDPVSRALKGTPASQWFFYGTLYTVAILVMGVRMMVQYRHSRYHLVRTASVMFFQTGFAFLIPAILEALHKPYFDFKHAWPLDYTFFFKWRIEELTSSGVVGWFMLFWGIGLALLLVPLLAFFFGKRWYCSWVCGCGGLAETLGDPFRHLSDKSTTAWRVERWLVHGVLVFAVVMTAIVLGNFWSGGAWLAGATGPVQKSYGLLIGSIFAGVVGTGFYPLMGNRVWCRFGCPLAAILGIVQRFKSRFRITTNGGQCISCGNCSTYCEMGIDVRAYAQRGDDVVRASCVGCGVCAAVCPRGVLRLENGPSDARFERFDLLRIEEGRVREG